MRLYYVVEKRGVVRCRPWKGRTKREEDNSRTERRERGE